MPNKKARKSLGEYLTKKVVNPIFFPVNLKGYNPFNIWVAWIQYNQAINRSHGLILLFTVIVLLELFAHNIYKINSPAIILQLFVIYAALTGGIGIGLVAATISVLYTLHFLSTPGEFLLYRPEDLNMIYLVSTVIPFTALIVGILHENSKQLIEERVIRAKEVNEKERVSTIIESISDAFVAYDKELRFTYVNKHAGKMLGRRAKFLIGRKITEIIPEKGNEEAYRRLRKAMITKRTMHYETYSSFVKCWIEVNVYPSKEGISLYFRDISARKKNQEALRESEERFRTMADNAPVMIWMSDIDGRRNYFNLQWSDFIKKNDGITSKSWSSLIHQDDLSYVSDIINVSVEARIEFLVEYRLKRRDGVYCWILDKGIPRFTERGEYLGYIGSCIDITSRKELEKKKDEFLSIASHELKTPITTIKAFNQILQKYFKNSSDTIPSAYLARMSIHLDKLTELVSELLDVTRIEQGKIRFNKHFFDLNDLLKDVIQDFQAMNIDFQFIIDGTSRYKIFGDRDRIYQVIMNLVSNAIKYSKEIKKIVIRIKDDEKNTHFSVRDFGIGISQDDKEKIFNKFFRVESVNNLTYPGLGLGLYISSEIIRRHGGSMEIESQLGNGSTFTFTIPHQKSFLRKKALMRKIIEHAENKSSL